MRGRVAVTVLLASAAATAAQVPAADWPQLFGPSRNGTTRMPITSGTALAVAWKKPIPVGGAGLAVAGGRVYTLGSDGSRDQLLALDAATGAEAWRLALGDTHADAMAGGPNATPAIAGDRILTVSSRCQLQAVDARTQHVAWTQDIGGVYASRFIRRGGCGMAPLVAGSRVILLTGSEKGPRLVAFDTATGQLAWTTADLPDSFSPAPGWTDAGGGQVLYHHSKPPGISGITAVDAGSGAVAWHVDGKEGESDATPVMIAPGRVLLETWPQVSLYDTMTGAALWTTREIAAQRAPAVSYQGHLYAFGGQSGEFLTCVDAATGRVKWTSRIYRGHLALAGDTLVILSESSGLLRLVAADPGGYREIARTQVLAPGARTGTPPSLAGGRIFVRNLEEIVAVTVR